MFKKILVLIFLFSTFCFGLDIENINNEQVLKVGAKYNEASAKIEAFKDAKRKLEKDVYKDYLKDINRDENLKSLENKKFYLVDKNTKIRRYLFPFYAKNILFSYAVSYEDNPNYTFYYDYFGHLVKIDTKQTDDYPKKYYSYSRYGNLIGVIFEVDETEQFIYNENGKLLAHWLGNDVKDEENSKLFKFLQIKRGEKEE